MKNILKVLLCIGFFLTPCFIHADTHDTKVERRFHRTYYKYHYWKHPVWGWGYWTYPAPPAAFYYDDFGRLVPLGFFYNPIGNLVAIPKDYGYSYYYNYKKAPVWWNKHQHPSALPKPELPKKPELIPPPKEVEKNP